MSQIDGGCQFVITDRFPLLVWSDNWVRNESQTVMYPALFAQCYGTRTNLKSQYDTYCFSTDFYRRRNK